MTEPLAPEADTPLGRRLAAEIAESGPMPLERFMAACLTDPEHGYYTTRSAIGAAGDFTTAPEISQIFGELIGLWAAQSWNDQGAPAPAVLAELGPGRGQLMADMLRAARALPAFRAAVAPHLVEISPALVAEQKARLEGEGASWARTVEDLPEDRPLLLVANEFFDALPIRQWRRVGGAWRARRVGLDAGRFVFEDAAEGAEGDKPDPALAARFPDPPEGAFLETRPGDAAIVAAIGARIAAQGGAALIVDYGYDDAARAAAGGRETLQAIHAKRPSDPLAHPGQADLTAHVNFDDLAALLPENVVAYGPLAQGALLFRLGAEARTAQLAAARPDLAPKLATDLRRLTDGAEMGQVFKALAIAPRGAPTPPGFEGLPPRGGRA